jgi:shikimate kinase/3-dehydroquinate synthase
MKIILTGMMGVGKTAVGKKLAERIDFSFLDLDKHLEKKTRLKVSEIFSRFGEARFRQMEREACKELSVMNNVVISTGGRTLLDKKNLSQLERSGIIITLLCTPEKILSRIKDDQEQRPLLACDSKEALNKIYNEREHQYLKLPNKLDVTHLKPEEVVEEIMKLINGEESRLEIIAGEKRSAVFIRRGIIDDIGAFLKDIYQVKKAFILSDEEVFSLYGERFTRGLLEADIEGDIFLLPPGERQKNLGVVKKMYAWLQEKGATRSAVFISFGGGVISDIGGFVASTFHRGMRLVNIPTTLLSQVDASIGGKNGVNLGEIKNQIGTFYFPAFVAIDPLLLTTLGPKKMQEGLIEALKAGVIADNDLFMLIKDHVPELMLKDLRLLEQVIIRAVKVKSKVVTQDPYDNNARATLNLGHTFGHALEGFYKFSRLSHGQAVGLGMICASKLGMLLRKTSEDLLPEFKEVLTKLKAPTRIKNMDASGILSLMQFDKKRKEGKMWFVVPKKIGETLIIKGVNKKYILESLKEISHG